MSGLLKHISTEIFISYPRAKYAGGFTYVETGLQRNRACGKCQLIKDKRLAKITFREGKN